MNTNTALSVMSKKEALNRIFSQGWPFVASRLFFIGNNFITALILTKYDEAYLSASPLVTSGQLFLLSTVIAVLYSTAIKTGMNAGARKFEEIGVIFQSSLVKAFLLTIPAVLISCFAKNLYIAAGQDAHLADLAQAYFFPFAVGILPNLMLNSAQQVLIGVGKSRAVLASTIGNTALLTLAGYFLTNGAGHLHGLGMAGMGWAFTIASFVNLIGLLVYMKGESFRSFNLFKKHDFSRIKSEVKSLSKLGLPIGFQVLAELISVLTVTILSGMLGRLPENQATDQYLAIVVVMAFALSQTVGTMISREVGAKNFENAKVIGKTAIMLSSAIGGAIALVFSTAHTLLARAFLSVDEVRALAYTANLFIINGVGEIADYVRNITTGALRGYRYVKWPAITNGVSMTLMAMPLAYVLGFPGHLDLVGVYTARACGMVLGAALSLFLYFRHIKAIDLQNNLMSAPLLAQGGASV